jgi:hypothetical protein
MLIGEVDGEPAGFCLGMPDWSPPTGPLLRSFQGKLGLVQIVRLMLGARRYRRAGLLGIGALPAYRGTGLAHSLAIALYSRYEELARPAGGVLLPGERGQCAIPELCRVDGRHGTRFGALLR